MSPLPNRDQLFKEVLLRAVTSPLSLLAGTTGVLLLPGPAWPFGLAALMVDAVWVWVRVRDPEYAQWCSDLMSRRRWRDLIQRLEMLSGALDTETSGVLAGIVEAQERLLGMYAAKPRMLPHTQFELTSLLRHCLSLAEKRRQLQSYLSAFRPQEVQREVAQLQQREEDAHDPVTKGLYRQAVEQKRQELENYVRLEDAVCRIDGQLAAVRCTFDNMLSKVVRLQAADTVAVDPVSDPVFMELNHLTRGVEALEASLNETLTLRGAV